MRCCADVLCASTHPIAGVLQPSIHALPQVTDEALAALGCPAHLTCLRLDYCVDITDAGLALLQGECCYLSPARLPVVIDRAYKAGSRETPALGMHCSGRRIYCSCRSV